MQGIMAAQWQSKKEDNLKELFVKTQAKRQEHTQGRASGDNGPNADEQVEEDTTPITKSYLEHLLCGLGHGDIAILRQEIAVIELEQKMDTVEHSHDAQVEELDHHRQELLLLQESNYALQHWLEDLKNRLWRSNIRIRRGPGTGATGRFCDMLVSACCPGTQRPRDNTGPHAQSGPNVTGPWSETGHTHVSSLLEEQILAAIDRHKRKLWERDPRLDNVTEKSLNQQMTKARGREQNYCAANSIRTVPRTLR
ncbi:hypothetical protein NDU88_002547 [Pleurodeles waltl]|uniref:Uncharacterized protein n=1 Tax=Pleurodeles waltl TaxID=8319 RepID=A0AAV7T2F3_PLEWA|nr:hypothetical protein NDU88_002547 [Pleurodeles waltl]